MKRKLMVLVAALALTAPGHGTVFFSNSGFKSGWDSAVPQSGTIGKVEEVSSPVYQGSTAILTEQTYVKPQGAHSETVKASIQANNQDRYYGQAIFFPANWNVIDKNTTFQQFSPENPSGPWILNWRQINNLWIRGNAGHVDLGGISSGVWIRTVMRLKTSNPGVFEYWVNGVKKHSDTTHSYTIADGSPTIRWSSGIYVTWWRDQDPGPQLTRQIYHDHFRVTDNYSEAEPANWNESGVLSGFYRIVAKHSGKDVVVESASTADGANIFQYTYGGSSSNDEWEIISVGSGYYRVMNRNSGKAMVVQSASTADNADIIQWAYGGSNTNDEWQFVNLGGGYYRIVNRNSGKVVDVLNSGTGNGVDIRQQTWDGGDNQQFQLISIP